MFVSQHLNEDISYTIFMNIHERIKELRKQNNFSQTELAKKLFVSQDTISLWEKGKSKPSIDYVILLAQLFGVTTDYLLGLED